MAFVKTTLRKFKSLFRAREDGSRVWILIMAGVLCASSFFYRGPEAIWFLFWKRQYSLTMDIWANLTIIMAARSCFANWVLIPVLSKKMQDTSLLILSNAVTIIALVMHALCSTIPMFVITIFVFALYSFGVTGARSVLSKLINPDEVGSAFALIMIVD